MIKQLFKFLLFLILAFLIFFIITLYTFEQIIYLEDDFLVIFQVVIYLIFSILSSYFICFRYGINRLFENIFVIGAIITAIIIIIATLYIFSNLFLQFLSDPLGYLTSTLKFIGYIYLRVLMVLDYNFFDDDGNFFWGLVILIPFLFIHFLILIIIITLKDNYYSNEKNR
tara:strand:+ start:152 stop:661 length:510 start_codon:yes stop_codon:yes gene_type:complete